MRAAASRHALIVSVVTFAELLTGAKLGHHDEATVRRFFEQVVSERAVIDDAVAEGAAELRAADRSLRMPDALIAATGSVRADVLLTGDRRMARLPGVGCDTVYVA